MKPSVDNIGQLLALKRHEQPDGEYFAEFLREFRARQQEEMLRRKTFGMFLERIGGWFSDLGGVRWVYAGGAAYAAVLATLFFWPHEQGGRDLPAAPVVHEVAVPVVVEEGAADKPVETEKRVQGQF